MKALTKRKWMARLGFTKVCCSKCGSELEPRGYNETICKGCGKREEWVFGNFWSEDASIRKDPYIKNSQFIPTNEQ